MSQEILDRSVATPEVTARGLALADRFDPQDLVVTIPTRWRKARWFWLFGVFAAAFLVLINLYQGTVGSAGDLQLWDDARRIFGFGGVPDSRPVFPLVRDVPSWFLLITISTSLVLLRHEWNRMARCLPQLVRNGVLCPKQVFYQRDGRVDVEQTYGGHWLVPAWLFRRWSTGQRDDIEENSLTVFLGAVRASAQRVRSLVTIVILLTSFVLALALIQGQRNGGLFVKIAPTGLTGDDRQDWLHATYAAWWAGNDNTLGHGLYFLVAIIAFAVVLSFFTGGAYSLYVAAALKHVCRYRADWAEADGDFGWGPLGKVYRTVWQALLLLSSSIAVIGSVLGFSVSSPVGFLMWVLCLSVPLFIVTPGIIFHRAVTEAKAAEARPLRNAVAAIDREIANLRAVAPAPIGINEAMAEVRYQADRKVLLDQLEWISAAKIKPLRVVPKIIFVVLMPQLIVVLGLVFGAIQAFR
ncbi:hypothetical protein [Allorhizocola rhizosphaerae]|uniref:hypothetical protein n=1 Tax=Allorhizocola rhizosphaerae TaxID=1872709 RepID=UPI0013C2D6F1|nr:hypothetical protein [Allorhizocola rhizosphaerae]